jgi:hypothetical protein
MNAFHVDSIAKRSLCRKYNIHILENNTRKAGTRKRFLRKVTLRFAPR